MTDICTTVLEALFYTKLSCCFCRCLQLCIRVCMDFPGGSVIKIPSANARDEWDAHSSPGSGRSPERGNSKPLQCSCLENSMDRGDWWAAVHGVTESEHARMHKCVCVRGNKEGKDGKRVRAWGRGGQERQGKKKMTQWLIPGWSQWNGHTLSLNHVTHGAGVQGWDLGQESNLYARHL